MTTSPRILVIDDEADLRELFTLTLIKMGLEVDAADSLAAARQCLEKREYALVLTDMRLPDGLGIELVQEVAANYRNMPIAVITAYGSTDNAVAALKAGAFDYLSKPVSLHQLRTMVQSALRLSELGAPPKSEKIRAPLAPMLSSRLTGQSAIMQDLRNQIAKLARSMAPISITGESGSGKEIAAREIHAHSARPDKPFIAVNCGAIPEALMEAEFFGYRKGAFTGANDDRDGFFQAAHGGTLMLDEVADLPFPMQVKLLRAIQERSVRKLGSTVEEPLDVRIISATHQDLSKCVASGKFRQDLYYRLNVIELRLPPLRERRDDIGALAEVILARFAKQGHDAVLSQQALEALRDYPFPGNVRELENILERALAFASDGVIEVADLALKSGQPRHDGSGFLSEKTESEPCAPSVSSPFLQKNIPEFVLAGEERNSLPDYLDRVERDIIVRALEKTRYNRTKAAQLLGISFRQLRYQMQKLAICEPE